MEILTTAVAGTVESSDIMVTIEPNPNHNLDITLESSVEKQFGNQIRKVIKETVEALKVDQAIITAVDKGALDCTVQARTIAAVYRAAGKSKFDWKEIDTWNA